MYQAKVKRHEIKTEEQLRTFIGIEKNGLLGSLNGYIDILKVENKKVTLRWLDTGHTKTFTIDEFLTNGGM